MPEDEVEILILLRDQADTKKVAGRVREEQAEDAGPRQVKEEIRLQVFETLQQTAAATQGPLITCLEDEMTAGRVSRIKSFYIVNLVYARVLPELIDAIESRPEVDSIWPNEIVWLVEPTAEPAPFRGNGIEWNISRVKAPEVWNELGIDGSGVVIGIIDTGVDWRHEALIKKYRGYNPGNPNHASHAYNWFDPYYFRAEPDDWQSHGTLVAGTVLGSDLSGENQIGVAPGARWIAARGLDDSMRGFTDVLLSAMEFMLAPAPNIDGTGTPDPSMAPDIVNNSWGFHHGCNPIFKAAIQSWRSAGIMPVFAALNAGPDALPIPYQIGLPANYVESFAVGATDIENNLASFSSRGPGACGDFIKPDISAPGERIRSAISWAPWRPRGYWFGSGTSMAAPQVAGTAALLLSANPSLTIAELESIMAEKTALPLINEDYPDSPNYGFGWGLVDAYAAVKLGIVLGIIRRPWHYSFP